jgi:hypothetical protein
VADRLLQLHAARSAARRSGRHQGSLSHALTLGRLDPLLLRSYLDVDRGGESEPSYVQSQSEERGKRRSRSRTNCRRARAPTSREIAARSRSRTNCRRARAPTSREIAARPTSSAVCRGLLPRRCPAQRYPACHAGLGVACGLGVSESWTVLRRLDVRNAPPPTSSSSPLRPPATPSLGVPRRDALRLASSLVHARFAMPVRVREWGARAGCLSRVLCPAPADLAM